LRTLWNLQSVKLGFSKEHLLLLRVDALTAGYNDASRPLLYRKIADHLRSQPGVRGVTYSENGLLRGTDSGDPVDVEGFVHKSNDDANARFDQLGPHYFSTLGIPLLLGREIEEQDTSTSLRVCLINEAFAKRFFVGRNPVGKHVSDTYGASKRTMEVIGVARDVRDHGLRGDVPSRFYVPIPQGDGDVPPSVYFEIRTSSDSGAMLNTVRKAILQVNSDLPIVMARTIDELIENVNSQPRIIAQLCGVFGAIALLLAATGLYGILSYMVARRTNEIGIRMALGATRENVIYAILRETSLTIAAGMAAGLLATFASTRLVASRLYGLSPTDPLTITAALAILGCIAPAASYIPAARAARVNPVVTLRHE
jgi:predicted permease